MRVKPKCERANYYYSYTDGGDLPLLGRMLGDHGWGPVSRGARYRVALQPLEIRFQFGSRLTANFAIFFKSLVDDFFEPGRDSRIQANWRNRGAIENRFENHSRSLALKRQRPGAHFIKHCPEREKIRAPVQFFS